MLLVCYAAQNGHVEMLQYLLGGHQKQEQKDIALKQLPFSKNCHSHIVSIRYVILIDVMGIKKMLIGIVFMSKMHYTIDQPLFYSINPIT